MAQFNTCPYCGANLDPGEVCECALDALFDENERESEALND